MASELENKVWELLRQVKFPGMSRDIVSFGFVDRVVAEGDEIAVDLVITTHSRPSAEAVQNQVREILSDAIAGTHVRVGLEVKTPEAPGQQAVAQDPSLIPGVRKVVAVASGKGGVGKSTVAANLAIRLAQLGHRVGLLDADIYGPSMPMMFGIDEKPLVHGDRLQPFERYGVKVMSLGFILEVDTPVIWRGPMVMKALEQLLGDVDWGELDYMIIDMPPGTGDAQLTISQRVPLAGAVIVSTPQDIALIDARKGLAMFEKVNVPVLGIVENMSGFVCSHCGETTDIFKRGGGQRTAELLGCPFLGSIPLDPAIVEGGDAGTPIVTMQPDGHHAEAFGKVAAAVIAQVASQDQPKLTIS
ncbi:MAG: Mrp/NBP35 family ATP-binding protein [Acidobacteria bacterium]|nr:Mrp/NBP35 family ATP-binding protein [Acidobacteriota bacterium]